MEELLQKFASAKTFEEQCEYAKEWMMEQSWGKFLKWDEFSPANLILFYPCLEDEDSTVWRDNTPEDEKERGTEAISHIVKELVFTAT